MCGIGGFVFKSQGEEEYKIKLIKNLFRELESRGTDAAGIALINSDKDLIRIFKRPIKASIFIHDLDFNNFLEDNIKDSNIVLLHTRQETRGSNKNSNNNHPIFNKANNSVLVHNGVISNYEELKKYHNFKMDGDVDSEVILKYFEKYGGSKDFDNILYTDLSGSFTFCLYHNKILNLFKYGNPLAIGYIKNKDVIMFASTKEIINNSFKEYVTYYGIFRELINNISENIVLIKEINETASFKIEVDNGSFKIEVDNKIECIKTPFKKDTSYKIRGITIKKKFSKIQKQLIKEFRKERLTKTENKSLSNKDILDLIEDDAENSLYSNYDPYCDSKEFKNKILGWNTYDRDYYEEEEDLY